MKHSFLLVAAVSALVVVAIPPRSGDVLHARSSKDALSAGTANTIAVANGADAFTPDLSDIGSAVSRDLVQKDVADTSNTVNDNPNTGDDDPPPSPILLKVALGTFRANVGSFTPYQLDAWITKALQYLCKDGTACAENKLYSVEVATRGVKTTIGKGYLDISVLRSRFHSIRVRDLMIGIAAAYGRKSVQDKKNCYPVSVGLASSMVFCNMGNYIHIDANDGYSRLEVSFYSKKEERNGKYDCKAIQNQMGEFVNEKQRLHDFGVEYGWPVISETYCLAAEVDARTIDDAEQDR